MKRFFMTSILRVSLRFLALTRILGTYSGVSAIKYERLFSECRIVHCEYLARIFMLILFHTDLSCSKLPHF